MKPLNKVSTWREEDVNKARFRYQNKQQRFQKKNQEKADRLKKQKMMLAKRISKNNH
jgi:hypothetical protein